LHSPLQSITAHNGLLLFQTPLRNGLQPAATAGSQAIGYKRFTLCRVVLFVICRVKSSE